MKGLYVRVNGRGNAWPVFIGKTHPFYDENDPLDIANASFSLVLYAKDDNGNTYIKKEIAIDAGHGTVQNIIKYSNRIPDAIAITHPHLDHTLSIDWIVQSKFRQTQEKYPLYTTRRSFELILQFYPHLKEIIEYHELEFDKPVVLFKDIKIRLTAYPVYHGQSAKGASMLLFEYAGSKVIFTGDILAPLLTKEAKKHLENANLIFTDANNRFPYPKSNHWSIAENENNSLFLDEFKGELNLDQLLSPHFESKEEAKNDPYFSKLLRELDIPKLEMTIKDFSSALRPQKIGLVHYSGLEDFKYYSENVLSAKGLGSWLKKHVEKQLLNSEFLIPNTGDLIEVNSL